MVQNSHERQSRKLHSGLFRFSIASGWCENDPTIALKGALISQRAKHYATLIESSEISVFMKSIKAYPFDLMRPTQCYFQSTQRRVRAKFATLNGTR